MAYNDELEFESNLIKELKKKGWNNQTLKNPTEKDLLSNWAQILFENNRQVDRLNNYPLTDTEMQQIIEQIIKLRTPIKLNGFINGKTIAIRRDNPKDKEHLGKEISLKIYDRDEIAAGQSRYQIAEQPVFNSKSPLLNNRRGDIMLLINGMPVVHIELKKSQIPISQATTQIEKYSHEGIYDGIFSLIQIFVAMTPEETLYFANPGSDNQFNPDFYFHWEDFNNEIINDWQKIASSFLSVPMVHQLIGRYTVPDDTDETLKVMRSYQYYASNEVSGKIAKTDWTNPNIMGGYIWHTTGSGKTMTSFKSAQLISNSKDADKVVFLMDRIELGLQSLRDYKGFSDENEDIQATENTKTLISKLKSSNTSDTLIVTSIQKMSRIKEEAGLNEEDIRLINKKKIVFIVDECHRSQFGEMHQTIKNTFPKAIFFGFTGTPILKENNKNSSDTSDLFGNELHRYSIADGIRDKNVLGFDIYQIKTFKDSALKKAVALNKAKAMNEKQAIEDPKKSAVYYEYMQKEMAGHEDKNGKYICGIEDYIKPSQYRTKEHQEKVVEDILENWTTLSHNNKFHALFATSSINEAIQYYKLFKKAKTNLKITVLVDPNIDNKEGFEFKEDGLVEIINEYNKMYKQQFSLPLINAFKKDVGLRLAHKKPYTTIGKEEQIDLLIVVDQMLTGFDSKWINTLYLDKVLQYENIIQAFSRTNRLFGPEKPHGTIKYYRKPHTMEKNIEKAIMLYSGDKPFGLFVPKLKQNIEQMKLIYKQIQETFKSEKIKNFNKAPKKKENRKTFISLFNEFNKYLEPAKIQGFKLEKQKSIPLEDYKALCQRYKEIATSKENKSNDSPYDIKGYLIEGNAMAINNDYMNSKFQKYLKALKQKNITEKELEENLNLLYKSFATLSQEKQKFANIFIHDIQSGNIQINENKSFMDYITEYQHKAENDQIQKISKLFEIDENKLKTLMNSNVNETNINEFGRFDELIKTINTEKAQKYFSKKYKKNYTKFETNMQVYELIRDFVLRNEFQI